MNPAADTILYVPAANSYETVFFALADPVTDISVSPFLSATAVPLASVSANFDVLEPPVLLITTFTVADPVTVNSYPALASFASSVDETLPSELVLFVTLPNTVTYSFATFPVSASLSAAAVSSFASNL